jgi:serine protease AprX
MRRGSLAVALALLASLAAVPCFTSAAAAAPPVKADRDGDRLFDDLEVRLDRIGPGDRLGVIVTLVAPASAGRVRGLEGKVGKFRVKHRYSIIDAFAATMTAGQARALARTSGVVQVEEDSVVRAFNDTAQQSFGVTEVQADAPGIDGNADGNLDAYSKDDLVAAVIDTGIDAGHKDLDEGKVIGWKDYVNGQPTPYDDNDHGSHVAATLAGDGDARADHLYKGVAPGGALVGVKVLNSSGSGTMSNVTAAIDWVVANKATYGVEAINLSLGTSGCADGTDSAAAAVNNAHAAGIVVAVAAGNSGPGTCTIGSPGAAADALTVGAMADMGVNGFTQAYFSSRGKTADGRIKPDVSAPGVSITSADAGTGTGYKVYSGTSMATPFTASVSLLIRDTGAAALTSQQVKDKIMQTAVDWGRGGDNKTAGSGGVDIDYGAGRLDAYAAVLSAGGAGLTSPPAVPDHELREGTLSGTGAVIDYELNVTDTQFPIAATLIIPAISGSSASTPDFDLYLYDPNGAQVAAAYTTRRQDELGYKPTATGTYKLRVKSYSGSGGYFVDISAGLGVDTTPPTVTSVSPPDGASGVGPAANVSVTFSEPMNHAATQAAFSLDSTAVDGTSFSWNGNTMTYNPPADLAPNTAYTATIGTGATDSAGNPLAAPQVWSFTTGPALTTVTAFPSATTIETGALRAGGAGQLGADDGSYYEVDSSGSSTRTTSWYASFAGVPNSLSNVRISYSGKNSRPCTQTVSGWRWSDTTWVQLDSRSVGTSEVAISNLMPGGAAADFVSGDTGNGELRVRVRCTRNKQAFYSSGDLLTLVYDAP